MVTIISKDVGEVRVVYKKGTNCVRSLEDYNEEYIKRELGIDGRR